MNIKEYSTEIAGKTLTAQFSDLAERANGSVILRYGDTVVLATAVMAPTEKEGMNFFPLTVDYEEKFYAAGQILGSKYTRREGRPSDEAILTGRVVDRTIRPLFNQALRREVQVVITVLSIDEYDPDVLAVNAASLALATSDIPWQGPVSAVRVCHHTANGFLIDPSYATRENDEVDLELVACGKEGNINMIEVSAREVSNELAADALAHASKEIEKLQDFQLKIVEDRGKEKVVIALPEVPEAIRTAFTEKIEPKLDKAIFNGPGTSSIYKLLDEWKRLVSEQFPDANLSLAADWFEERVNEILHNEAIDRHRRADGRKLDEVRKLYCQAGGISSVIHGSGIFYRGGTHVLSVLTLGGPEDSQLIEGMETQMNKRFMHHYNFPPFSVGEVGRIGMNRRMIGHGALAEKALNPVIPPKETFPYTIRIVSESTASNGSTSMASVCGSTLALMDAGVPIKAPVAGIAMGLMMRDPEHYVILTDIQGPEDHYGDMDFKVAGTRNGITAIQMDIKVDGVPLAILTEALQAAQKARHHILDAIEAEISAPRPDISPRAPKIITVQIKEEQIGLLIGPGGKTVKRIREETGAEIDIEDDGTVYITGKNGSAERAREMVLALTREYEVGDQFVGTVTKLFDFGAVVEIGPQTDGLVHISEVAPFRINKISDVLKVGDKVPVSIIKMTGDKISLSIKADNPDFIKNKNLASTQQSAHHGTDKP